MTEMCKAIGVDNSLIQMAVKLNDWDIVRTSQDLAFKSKMLDRNELLVIIFATDKKLKDAEKLKNDIDRKKEADKKAKEENEKRLQEEEKQKAIIEQQRKNQAAEQQRLYENSDYVDLISSISEKFNDWLKKGEFEKSDDYVKRLNLREITFLEICEAAVQKTLAKEVEYVSGENWYGDNSGEESFILYEYNADKEFFPFYFRYKQIEFQDTIFVPFSDAKTFKEQTDYYSISYSKQRKDYAFSNYYIYPTSIIFQNVNGKKAIEVPLNFSEIPKQIQFTTNDLKLTNYNFEELHFDFNDYKNRKSEILLTNAQQMEEKEDLETALSLYSKLLEFDKNSSIAKSKIESITQTLNERKRKVLIEKAQELLDKGKLSESKKLYVEANSIRKSSDIDEKIKNIENTIVESKKKHDELKKQIGIISINNSFIKQTKLFDDLEKMKRGYGTKYNTCVDSINTELNNNKSIIDSQFKEFQANKNIEIWTENNQKLLELCYSFILDYERYKLFETNIYSAVQNEDKKYLKILKEDEIRTIIETVIQKK